MGAVALLLGALVAMLALVAVAVGGTVDALTHPPEVWARAGLRRGPWVGQAIGVVCTPVVLLYSGVYFTRVRPRLLAAERDLSVARRTFDSPVATVSAERVRIRLPRTLVATLVATSLAVWTISTMTGGVLTGWNRRWVVQSLLCMSTFTAVLIVQCLVFAVVLTPEHLVLRGLTRRRIAWTEIVAIEPHYRFGTSSVQVWTAHRRHRLRVPSVQLGIGRQRFADDLAVLQGWWAARS